MPIDSSSTARTAGTPGGYARDSTWEHPPGYDGTSTTGTQDESQKPASDDVKKAESSFNQLRKRASRKLLNVVKKAGPVPDLPKDQAEGK